MHARTLRYHANISRQFGTESIRKPIANSSHPSGIGAVFVKLFMFELGNKTTISNISVQQSNYHLLGAVDDPMNCRFLFAKWSLFENSSFKQYTIFFSYNYFQ